MKSSAIRNADRRFAGMIGPQTIELPNEYLTKFGARFRCRKFLAAGDAGDAGHSDSGKEKL
jgi:hypothetical protein